MICNKCGELEGVHPYGRFKLCDTCMRWAEINCKSEPHPPEIRITHELKLGSEGSYRQGENVIILRKTKLTMEHILSHEAMHHVLNHFISVQASFCYDNVSGLGELEYYVGLL